MKEIKKIWYICQAVSLESPKVPKSLLHYYVEVSNLLQSIRVRLFKILLFKVDRVALFYPRLYVRLVNATAIFCLKLSNYTILITQ